jgi:hypothetical protein
MYIHVDMVSCMYLNMYNINVHFHVSYILIHLVCQSVTGLGKGRAGHGHDYE